MRNKDNLSRDLADRREHWDCVDGLRSFYLAAFFWFWFVESVDSPLPSPPLPSPPLPSLPPSFPPSLPRTMSPKRQSAESAGADEPV